MSLLMEALRKAEEAKRKIQTENPSPPAGFSRAPANQPDISPVPVLTASPEPDLTPNERDSGTNADYTIDNFLRGTSNESRATKPESAPFTTRRKSSRASVEELQSYLDTNPELEEPIPALRNDVSANLSPNAQQRAAGAVFAAKQKSVNPHATRNILALIVPIGAAVLWYLANSLNSSFIVDPALLTSNGIARSLSDELDAQAELAAQNPAPAATVPVQEQVAVAPPPVNDITSTPATTATQEPDISVTANLPQPAIATGPASITQSQTGPVTELATEQEPDTTPGNSRVAAETSAANAIAETPSGTVLEVSHSVGTTRNNPQLLDAYASLQAGDLAAASTLYQQVLQQFPNNRDALLGKAAIAIRQGNLLQAREFYSRLMQLNPKDPLARTGLLQTVQELDQLQHEQELRRLLQQYPDVAPLSFALGNLFAAQRRWNEAQSAYFDAFLFARQSSEGAINPDYAYNLAVSLEQLNQSKAALDYYRQAQTLAAAVSPGFDRQDLSRRIAFLERNNP